MQKKTGKNRIYESLNERFQLDNLINFMKKKEVPLYRGTIWYYFGGISLLLFIIQVVTGMLLLLYYKGSAELAFESVQFISAKVKFGWLIRSIHSWSAILWFYLLLFTCSACSLQKHTASQGILQGRVRLLILSVRLLSVAEDRSSSHRGRRLDPCNCVMNGLHAWMSCPLLPVRNIP